MKQRVLQAVRWTTVAMAGRSGLQVLQTAVLARLLAPGDFGNVAIVMTIITFFQLFADVGVSNAIVQKRSISDEQLSSLFWLNVASGAILALSLSLASPLVASWYRMAALAPLLATLSLGLLATAFGQQLRALAQKRLEFQLLAKIELYGALTGFGTALCWAFVAPGPMALVAGFVANAITSSVLCWIVLSRGWRPQRRFRLDEIREFTSFGGYVLANNLVNALNSQADILIGGRILGPHALGLYSLPRDLSLRLATAINPIVTRVAFPVLAGSQHDRKAMKSIYLRTLALTSAVNFPLYAALVVFAPEVVAILFGTRWSEAAPLLRLLASWGLVRSTGAPVGSLLLAAGRADLAFKWNLGLLLVTPPAIWFGATHGAVGLGVALLSVQLAFILPGWAVLVKPTCGAGLTEYLSKTGRPLAATVLAACAAYVGTRWCPSAPVTLIAGGGLGAAVYVAASWYLNRHWLLAMRDLAQPFLPAFGRDRNR